MAGPRVLITRPEPLAGELADLLESCGASVTQSPFLKIEPVSTPRPVIDGAVVVALTSRMTFPHVAAHVGPDDPLLSLPCYCVGDKTAQEARCYGWSRIHTGPGQGIGLAHVLIEQEPEKPVVLHIGAQDTDGDMAMILSRAGFNYVRWSVYRAVQQTQMPQDLAATIRSGGLDIVLFYSARTAKAFISAVQTSGLQDNLCHMTVLALSEKVAAPLHAVRWKRLAVAARPDQTALIELFQSTCL